MRVEQMSSLNGEYWSCCWTPLQRRRCPWRAIWVRPALFLTSSGIYWSERCDSLAHLWAISLWGCPQTTVWTVLISRKLVVFIFAHSSTSSFTYTLKLHRFVPDELLEYFAVVEIGRLRNLLAEVFEEPPPLFDEFVLFVPLDRYHLTVIFF